MVAGIAASEIDDAPADDGKDPAAPTQGRSGLKLLVEEGMAEVADDEVGFPRAFGPARHRLNPTITPLDGFRKYHGSSFPMGRRRDGPPRARVAIARFVG